ncbi:MAG: outer membrane beta-barrel protein [Gemmatimonadota bacterium]
MHPVSRKLPVGLIALAILALFVPSVASAQGRLPRLISVGIGGGGTVPVGDFANDVKTGWNGLAYLQYEPLSGAPWAVRAEAQYSKAKYTDDLLLDAGAGEGDDLSNKVLYVGISAVYHLARPAATARPYLIGGLGLYQQTASLTDASGISLSDSESGFGFNGGAGIRFGGAIGVFVETRFHQFSVTPSGAEKSTSRFIPVSVGVTF